MSKDLLDHAWVVDEGDHPHLLLANRAVQRVNMPSLVNQVAPLPGGKLEGWWRGGVISNQ
jgi:hypothetical protein